MNAQSMQKRNMKKAADATNSTAKRASRFTVAEPESEKVAREGREDKRSGAVRKAVTAQAKTPTTNTNTGSGGTRQMAQRKKR